MLMIKKFTYSLIIITFCILIGQANEQSSIQPPTGNTGADGSTCTNCHGSFGLNSGGGNVTISGLPTSGYTPNQTYTFSLTITHGTADRTKWGFSIAARTSGNADVGTFTTTNSNAGVNGSELSHNNAPSTAATNSFTFNNLKWTAPATNQGPITFYYTGNAANGNSGTSGDHIYSGTTNFLLPVNLNYFHANNKGSDVVLNWQTASENNSSHFTIQKSTDNQHFIDIAKVQATGNSTTAKTYQYVDAKPSYFERDIYYRLALVDKDASYKYSTVSSVKLKAPATFINNVYPNPVIAGKKMQIEMIAEMNANVNIELISMNGRRMKNYTTSVVKGNNLIEFETNSYIPAGMYSLIVRIGTQTMQVPIMVK
jgi:hypothetical protein